MYSTAGPKRVDPNWIAKASGKDIREYIEKEAARGYFPSGWKEAMGGEYGVDAMGPAYLKSLEEYLASKPMRDHLLNNAASGTGVLTLQTEMLVFKQNYRSIVRNATEFWERENAKLNADKAKLRQKNEELNAIVLTIPEKDNRIRNLGLDLKAKEDELRLAKEALDVQAAKFKNERMDHKRLQEEYKKLEDKYNAMKGDYDALKGKYEKALAEIEGLKKLVAELQKQRTVELEKIKELEAAVTKANAENKELKEERGTYILKIKQTEEAKEAVILDLGNKTKELEDIKSKLAQSDGKNKTLEDSYEKLAAETAALVERFSTLDEYSKTQEKEFTELKSKDKKQTETIANLNQGLEVATASLEKAEQERIAIAKKLEDERSKAAEEEKSRIKEQERADLAEKEKERLEKELLLKAQLLAASQSDYEIEIKKQADVANSATTEKNELKNKVLDLTTLANLEKDLKEKSEQKAKELEEALKRKEAEQSRKLEELKSEESRKIAEIQQAAEAEKAKEMTALEEKMAQKSVQEKNQAIKEKEEELNKRHEENLVAQKQESDLRIKAIEEKSQEEIKVVQQKVQDANEKLDKTSQKLAAIEHDLQESNNSLHKYEEENAQLKSDISAANGEISGIKIELDSTKKELSDAKIKQAASDEKIEALSEAVSELKTKEDNLTLKLHETESQRDTALEQVASLNKDFSEQSKELIREKEDREKVEKLLKESEEKRILEWAEAVKVKIERDEAKERLELTEGALKNLKDFTTEQIGSLNTEKEALKKELEEKNNALLEQKAKHKEEMAAVNAMHERLRNLKVMTQSKKNQSTDSENMQMSSHVMLNQFKGVSSSSNSNNDSERERLAALERAKKLLTTNPTLALQLIKKLTSEASESIDVRRDKDSLSSSAHSLHLGVNKQ